MKSTHHHKSNSFRAPIIILGKFLRRSRMLKIFLLVLFLNFLLAAIYSYMEGIEFHLGLYWATDTLTNTGSGLVPPTSKSTWILTTVFMWLGLGITLLFVEFVYVHIFQNIKKEGERTIKFENHIVLVGYCPKIRHFLHNLPGALGEDHNYALVADIPDRPFDLPKVVEFIRGNPEEERILLRAGIEKAQQAIIVVEDDAEAVLITMTIQSINVKVRISVNVQSEENVKHVKRLGVEQIICDEQLTGNALIESFYKNQEDFFL
ncbi:MAG: NAD-binding protein [Promethearchaeota archaeon]